MAIDRTPSGIVRNGGWKPLVERPFDPNPPADGIDFILTPQERDAVALAALHLEHNRRQQNLRDTAQSVADELVRRERAE